ncbi:MAG: hypothetical protein U5Q44_00960 [Dehalococcoidia bacterium]|nr:hypothetical protein [Dehalococcoidia bacterium]
MMGLLAPRASLAIARNTPRVIDEAWERRIPHRIAGGTWSVLQAVATWRPGRDEEEDEPVIDASSGAVLRNYTGQSYETAPAVVIRPSADPAAPQSAVGMGAAAHFAPAAPEAEVPLPPPPQPAQESDQDTESSAAPAPEPEDGMQQDDDTNRSNWRSRSGTGGNCRPSTC